MIRRGAVAALTSALLLLLSCSLRPAPSRPSEQPAALFVQYCVPETGGWTFSEPCDFDPAAHRWKLPIRVANIAPAYQGYLEASFLLWEKWMGREMFVQVDSFEDFDVIIFDGKKHPLWLAATGHVTINNTHVAYIEVFDLSPHQTKVFAHELGHVLYLDHQDDRGSLMYPSLHADKQVPPEATLRVLRRIYND